jgi:hypothetical protein
MDSDALVENLIDDGQTLVEQLPLRGFDVTAAFWLRASEESKWHYYLVSPVVETEGLVRAYRRLHPLVRAMPQPFRINPLEIRLIAPSNPIARDVLDILRRTFGSHPGPIQWDGTRLGDLSIDGAHLYAVPATAP